MTQADQETEVKLPYSLRYKEEVLQANNDASKVSAEVTLPPAFLARFHSQVSFQEQDGRCPSYQQ